jgi:pimeloyl-ACP methyl ester carboxylesterase
MHTDPVMPFVTTDDLKIHFKEAGAGRTVLVLLHGNFASWRWWRPLFDRLDRGVHAYAPVMRGCGHTIETGESKGDRGIPRLARDLDQFSRALSLPRFHLVGHSLGGAAALQFALDQPGKVRSLTLVSPAPPGGLEDMRMGDSQAARTLRMLDPERGFLLPWGAALYRWGHVTRLNRVMLRRAILALMPTTSPDSDTLRELVDDAARLTPDTVLGFHEGLHRWQVADRLAELRMPVQILAGGLDKLVPLEPLREAATVLPRARLVVWDEVGHSPMMERPGDFAEMLLRFMARRSLSLFLRRWFWRVSGGVRGYTRRLNANNPWEHILHQV